MYPIFTCVVVFCLWLRYTLNRSDRITRQKQNKLWEEEHEANFTRRQPLDGLHYITFSENAIPLIETNDMQLNKTLSSLQSLTSVKIVKLSEYTNTELKKMYGPANLPLLTEYDVNYTTLVRLLQQYAARLSELSLSSEAVRVLEYSVSIGCDMASTYKLLADLYHEKDDTDKIASLIDTTDQLNPLYRESTIRYLQNYL